MSILDFVRTVDPAKPPKLNGVRSAEQAAPQAMPFQTAPVGPDMGNQPGGMTQQTADFLRENPAAGQKLSDGQALRSQWLSTPVGGTLSDASNPMDPDAQSSVPTTPMNGTFNVMNTSEGTARLQRANDIRQSMIDSLTPQSQAPAASPLPQGGMRAQPARAQNSSFASRNDYSAPARLTTDKLGDLSPTVGKYWR